MTISKKVREKVFELLGEGLSAEKIIAELTRDPQWNKEDIPTPKTTRNWLTQESNIRPRLIVQERTLARNHDIRIFKESEQIMNEQKT